MLALRFLRIIFGIRCEDFQLQELPIQAPLLARLLTIMTVKILVNAFVTTVEILSLITMAITEVFLLIAFAASMSLMLVGTVATRLLSFVACELSSPLSGPDSTPSAQLMFGIVATIVTAGFLDVMSESKTLSLQRIY